MAEIRAVDLWSYFHVCVNDIIQRKNSGESSHRTYSLGSRNPIQFLSDANIVLFADSGSFFIESDNKWVYPVCHLIKALLPS